MSKSFYVVFVWMEITTIFMFLVFHHPSGLSWATLFWWSKHYQTHNHPHNNCQSWKAWRENLNVFNQSIMNWLLIGVIFTLAYNTSRNKSAFDQIISIKGTIDASPIPPNGKFHLFGFVIFKIYQRIFAKAIYHIATNCCQQLII